MIRVEAHQSGPAIVTETLEEDVNVIVDDDRNDSLALAVKRNTSGKSLQKNARSIVEPPLPLSPFLNPLPDGNPLTKIRGSKIKKKDKTPRFYKQPSKPIQRRHRAD